jgi:phenylacetate-CoA ligase
MTLRAEAATSGEALAASVGESLRAVLKLGGQVDLVTPGTLANDGKVIDDQRSYG